MTESEPTDADATRATVIVTAQSWDEDRIVSADAEHAVARVVYTTELAGDLVGESTVGLLISYVAGTSDDPGSLAGPYLGYEQISGTLAGRTGTFVLAVHGAHGAGVARTEGEIVPDSGTGELAGIAGSGAYAADAMTYTMTLDYVLP